jgi:rhodanese-related sulfurtransferase
MAKGGVAPNAARPEGAPHSGPRPDAEGDTAEALSAERARVLIAGGEAKVIDIRPIEEWRAVGNIPGARRVPEDELDSRLDAIPKDQRVIVVCGDGERSAGVAAKLRDRGYEAASIEGGMEAWEDEKQPLQPSEDPDLPSKDVDLSSEKAKGG